MKGFGLIAVKMVAAVFVLAEEDAGFSYFLSLVVNIAFTELSSLVGYQFAFFAYCARCRYEAFVAHAKQKLEKFHFGGACGSDSAQNIQLIEDLAHLHFEMAKVLSAINAVFSIEVRPGAERSIIENFKCFAAVSFAFLRCS